MGSEDGRISRTLSAVLMLVCFMLLFFRGFTLKGGTMELKLTSTRSSKAMEWEGRGAHADHGSSSVVYVSKRRVPNGPDPIHNRHIGVTRRQPGRI